MGFIEKNEKLRVEHGDFDIQLNQSGQAINGFSEVRGFGIKVHFFNFGVGSHHGGHAPERIQEHSVDLRLFAWDVAFMDRTPSGGLLSELMLGMGEGGG